MAKNSHDFGQKICINQSYYILITVIYNFRNKTKHV